MSLYSSREGSWVMFFLLKWLSHGLYSLCVHRRTGYFLPGGAVNRLPKKFFHVASNFYKTVEQKRGPMQKHRPYWLMKMARCSFSGSIPAKFKHKLRRHKQPFGKTATTVVLCIGQIEASASPPPPPQAYPGRLTPLLSRGGGNLIIRVFQGVGNLIPMQRGWGIWTVVSISCEMSGRFARDELSWQGRGVRRTQTAD